MKKLILFLLIMFPSVIVAQVINYQIIGRIPVDGYQYYAYLYAKEKIEKVKIQNGNFKFSGQPNIGNQLMVSGILFIDKRENITAEEITAVKKHPSILRDKYNSFRLVLENMTIFITNPDKIDDLKFEKGGGLTNLVIESYQYFSDKDFLEFFKKYPDSPVSASFLNQAIKFRKMPIKKKEWEERFRVNEAYELLSDRLKITSYVKSLKLEIDKL